MPPVITCSTTSPAPMRLQCLLTAADCAPAEFPGRVEMRTVQSNASSENPPMRLPSATAGTLDPAVHLPRMARNAVSPTTATAKAIRLNRNRAEYQHSYAMTRVSIVTPIAAKRWVSRTAV